MLLTLPTDVVSIILGRCGPADTYSLRLTDKACREAVGPAGKLDTVASMILYARKRKHTAVILELQSANTQMYKEHSFRIYPRKTDTYYVKKVEPSKKNPYLADHRSYHKGLSLSEVLELVGEDQEMLFAGFNPARPDYPMTRTKGKKRNSC